MQITEVLHVSYEQFHIFLQEMVLNDVKQVLQEDIKEVKEGFHYSKRLRNQMQKEEQVEVVIEQLRDEKYQVAFLSSQGKHIISYAYHPVNAHDTQVLYEESYDGVNTSTQLSHTLFAWLAKRGNKKKIKALLKQIERMIQEKTEAN